MKLRRLAFALSATLFVLALALPLVHPKGADAAFNANLIMDDVVFNSSNSMSAAEIDAFLNTFPNSCISTNSGFSAVVPAGYSPPPGKFIYGDFTTAGNVIATAAQVYGLNPQVLLATLQKEQSLVIGGAGYCENGDYHKYAAAMGYGCPDGGTVYNYSGVSLYRRNGAERTVTGSTCVNNIEKAGFSQQVIRAAWLLKFGQQRSLGNTGWAVITGTWNNSDDPGTYYGGPMTPGTFSRINGGAAASYDGYITIDSTAVIASTGATAALYWYTPHFHGNQNFVSLFEGWFGGTISSSYFACKNGTNVPGVGTGVRVLPTRPTWGADFLSLAQINDTGTACIESHGWSNANFQSWGYHVATNRQAITPADARLLTADTDGDGRDELIVVEYRGTASGRIEMHAFTPDLQHWASHIASNRPAVDPADSEVIAADTDGDGRDELLLVDYRNTASGMVEIHGWNSNYQQWTSHVATNRPAISPANAEVISADTNGDVRDELHLVEYRNNGSGYIEVHSWAPGYQSWNRHVATNRPAIDPGTRLIPFAEVISADINGNLAQEFILVQYKNTGSGRVEIHGWSDNLQQWIYHKATSQGAY